MGVNLVLGMEDGGIETGPVEEDVCARALPVIEEVLGLYPEAVRGGLLQTLALHGRFRMRNKPFLGAAKAKKHLIHLAIRRRTEARGLRSTLHHEIGHLVEADDRFPMDRWKVISDGAYTGRGHRDSAGKASGPDVHHLGFVTRYASRNVHEDIAEMAELGFTRPRKLKQLAADYAAIARKLPLLTAAYGEIVPGLALPWNR